MTEAPPIAVHLCPLCPRIDPTLERISANGGEVVKSPYSEGDLWVATFRDPAGNVIGTWQQGPRRDPNGNVTSEVFNITEECRG